jgi:Ca2+-transporting ATPase
VTKNNITDSEYISPDCFLLSQSLVVEGCGRAIVCAVGANSRRGMKEEVDFNSPDAKTPLKLRLENLANDFTSRAVKYGLLIFLLLSLHLVITASVTTSKEFPWYTVIFRAIENATLTIAIIVMAVPEGLPLAVNIALAFIVTNMRKSGVLIKDMESPERMQQITNICTGKTATLTTNKMKVGAFYANSRLVNNSCDNTFVTSAFEDDFVALVA